MGCTGSAKAATVGQWYSLAAAVVAYCCKAVHFHSSLDTAGCCCTNNYPSRVVPCKRQAIRADVQVKETYSVAADADPEGVMKMASSANADSYSTTWMEDLRGMHQPLLHSGVRCFLAARDEKVNRLVVGASLRPCGRSSTRPLSASQLS